MSNPWCNDGKSSPNSCNRWQDLLGWFRKLNADDKEGLIRELSTKVQGISIEKLPSEKEEDFKARHFQELLTKLSCNSKTSVGSKILKAFLRVRCRSPNLYKKKPEQFMKVKSIDSREGLPGLQKQATASDEESSLNPELFKRRTLDITGGRPQDGQGSIDQQQ